MTESLIRLHISPLNPHLLPSVLGAEVAKVAKNISFHSLQAFPENDYGFVDLPAMDAEKVKKKLNGAILKGKKMKVEEAHPKKRKRGSDETQDVQSVEEEAEVPAVSKKRSKRERDVLPGHELSPGRKVKRGWTENKSEVAKKRKDKSKSSTKQQATSKYSEKDELLFRTKTPKNKVVTTDKEAKKRKRKVEGGTETVHEFENSTTIPSFLRAEASNGKKAVEYEDGKGWVDDLGEVIEEEHPRASRRRKASKRGIQSEVVVKQVATRLARVDPIPAQSEEDSEDSKDSADSADAESASSVLETDKQVQKTRIAADSDETDSDNTSSSGTSESDTSSHVSSEASDEENIPGDGEDTAPVSTVHPLEALFKKPMKPASSQHAANSQDVVKPSLEVHTSFSFFEPGDDNDNLPPMPMTPFSSQDLSTRGVRSAAPTPDTAHPSRMGSIFNGEESDGELSEMGEDVNPNESSHSLQPPQTEFEKQFWEKRGENNRAWKARRRAVLKEKRQRENRSRRPKNW